VKTVFSSALAYVNKSLGISGAGAPETELDDGNVYQMLDVSQSTRRGLSLSASTGIFTGIMRNTHAGADSQLSVESPYSLLSAPLNAYPANVPDLFDIWILFVAMRRISGTSTITATLYIDFPDEQQGWGIDQAGGDIVAGGFHMIAAWDSLIEEQAIFAGGNALQRIGMRLPRTNPLGTQLEFNTTSGAAAVYEANIILGLFPVSMGQDVAT